MKSDYQLRRRIDPYPFVPRNPATLDERCQEIFSIQVSALARRLRHVQHAIAGNTMRVSIGISGGLDSTLAALVTIRAFDALCWDRKNIITVTMPGYGTTARTRGNATRLSELLCTDFRVIPIGEAVTRHLEALGHKPPCGRCLQCQNAQARERTQILMDLAFTVGTGDLSEIALGWCTYNGDQQSMYGVNAGIPKTLVKHLVRWVAARNILGEAASRCLSDIVETPISPELEATAKPDEVLQKTEDIIGPYELHDFTLFHMLRYGSAPEKILYLACQANANAVGQGFSRVYDEAEILHWLCVFYERFAPAQFKRDAGPDGVRVGSVALSQRGDWRMPADADLRSWIRQLKDRDARKQEGDV